LWKRLTSHNISERSNKIKAQASEQPTSKNFEKELNSIANTIQTAMLQAEEKCANSPAAPYSKKLANHNPRLNIGKSPNQAPKQDATCQRNWKLSGKK
jgi:hypothetical protein